MFYYLIISLTATDFFLVYCSLTTFSIPVFLILAIQINSFLICLSLSVTPHLWLNYSVEYIRPPGPVASVCPCQC